MLICFCSRNGCKLIKLKNAIIRKDQEGWRLGERLFLRIVENFHIQRNNILFI